jgi:hypothetical protein
MNLKRKLIWFLFGALFSIVFGYAINIYKLIRIIFNPHDITTALILKSDAETLIGNFRTDPIYTNYNYPALFLIENHYINAIMSQGNCDAIAIYPCKKTNGSYSLVFAGTNMKEVDNNGDFVEKANNHTVIESGSLYEHIFPCPSNCPTNTGVWTR